MPLLALLIGCRLFAEYSFERDDTGHHTCLPTDIMVHRGINQDVGVPDIDICLLDPTTFEELECLISDEGGWVQFCVLPNTRWAARAESHGETNGISLFEVGDVPLGELHTLMLIPPEDMLGLSLFTGITIDLANGIVGVSAPAGLQFEIDEVPADWAYLIEEGEIPIFGGDVTTEEGQFGGAFNVEPGIRTLRVTGAECFTTAAWSSVIDNAFPVWVEPDSFTLIGLECHLLDP